MPFLIFTSLIWAFSFPLIGHVLKGVNPLYLASVRMLISLIVFFPFFRANNLSFSLFFKLLFIGMIQYGFMYVSYLHAYQFLAPHEVALFTIFTPLYITLINDMLTRRFHRLFLLTALLAVVGTGVIKFTELNRAGLLQGFFLMQASNVCFAFGQIYYRKVMSNAAKVSNTEIYAVLYLGGFLVPAIWTALTVNWTQIHLSSEQCMVLAYLGAIASGLAFFLWNIGARRVNAGTLAVFNNLKIPLAIAVSLLFFGESTNLKRLFIGGGIVLLALVLNEVMLRRKKQIQND